MQNWLSKLFFVGIGLVLVAGIVLSLLPKPAEVDIAEVVVGDLLVTVDEDGKTRIREKYVVSTPLSGRLLRIDMDPGDAVNSSDTLLATIEPRDPELLDARAIAQAEARVLAAEAAHRNTAPLFEQARLEQENAEVELQRARKALRGGGITESELDTAEKRYRYASEGLRSARHAEEIATFELQQARAALLRSKPPVKNGGGAEPNGWNFTIRSPIDGRVLRVFQESAAVVTAGTPLLELGNPTDLEVEIDVLSSDAVRIEPQDRVILEHWGGGAPLEGRVRLVEPAGFTKVSTLGVEEQRVNVIVDLIEPPEQRLSLGDGFRVEARIVVDEVAAALVVPSSALFFRSGDERTVFKVVGDRAVATAVTIGRQNGLLAEVIGGLQEGDRVVVNPSDKVTDGVQVRQR